MFQPKDTAECTQKTKSVYNLPKRDTLQTYRHIQMESEGVAKGNLCKWKSKESWRRNNHIRQNRL